ncbi:class I SAM-dependent methyltransferase [Halovulum dunhuangense]|uniref:Class I SAM-dependent methyltransferase n=1 Tax=Halovulum dunhuangense TaxID=1505036 RepID=A0A849KZ97_9RHOB|nr:class I SAM-dependent methyltransferase [Halovulum dunhuangense]NNU79392.1 class I SAM-dependent methyltransferase [Halovulum dunhuangense]
MRDPYIFSRMHRIPGYLDPGDALILRALLGHQNASGYRGGAAEIGIYYGRSFFLIERQLRTDERALAIDLFDAGDQKSGRKRLESFTERARDMGCVLSEGQVIRADSRTLAPEDIIARIGRVRMFSIDGGHGLAHVRADADLAAATLSPEGVIVFDDFCNPEWPEVTAAILDFLRANWDRLRPFAVSQKKLYIAHTGIGAEYGAALDRAEGLRRLPRAPVNLFGHTALRVSHRLWQRIGYEILCRMGLGRMSAMLY